VQPATQADTSVSQEVAMRWQAVYGDLLGIPYRFGGTTRGGFDCSGLVLYAYDAYDGRHVPRTVQSLYDQSAPVGDGQLATGDLLFYSTDGRGPSHVGIYLWGDTFLHASTSLGVTLTSVYDAYYARRHLGARRLPR
jgi:cell wall-associated NlpC family hydrolase